MYYLQNVSLCIRKSILNKLKYINYKTTTQLSTTRFTTRFTTWLGCNSNALRYQAASCTHAHASRKLSGLPHPTVIMWLSPLFFFPPHCSWLEHSSWSGRYGLFPWGIQGYGSRITQFVFWYSTDNRCRELRPTMRSHFSISVSVSVALVA